MPKKNTVDYGKHATALDLVTSEREKQNLAQGEQVLSLFEGVNLLIGKVGETGQAANEEELKKSLAQVAAVAVQILETII